MPTDDEIREVIEALRADGKRPTFEAIAEQLVVDDLEALNARLLQAAKDGIVWMVAAWWHRRQDDSDHTLHFAYYVRRGEPDDDIAGR
ncbi:MAG TPA: hypothetical protein VNO51_03555 [Ilumatobacteraceae bacterium]|nr:hypothetical protein [Ilumatobacteraceae bacterium]